MNEAAIRNRIRGAIRKHYPGSLILCPNDRMTEGMPDLMVFHDSVFYGFELKFARRIPKDPAAPWLEHGFTGPQIVTLQDLVRNRVHGVGVIWDLTNDQIIGVPAERLYVGLTYRDAMNHSFSIILSEILSDTNRARTKIGWPQRI